MTKADYDALKTPSALHDINEDSAVLAVLRDVARRKASLGTVKCLGLRYEGRTVTNTKRCTTPQHIEKTQTL